MLLLEHHHEQDVLRAQPLVRGLCNLQTLEHLRLQDLLKGRLRHRQCSRRGRGGGGGAAARAPLPPGGNNCLSSLHEFLHDFAGRSAARSASSRWATATKVARLCKITERLSARVRSSSAMDEGAHAGYHNALEIYAHNVLGSTGPTHVRTDGVLGTYNTTIYNYVYLHIYIHK